jgi:serine/threonine-protein kinase
MGERKSLRAGDTFAGTYFLKTLLGEGGMGQVWRALHIKHERDVALKTILPDVRPAELELFREHFLQEAQVVLRLSHKNIVPVFDRGEHDGILYFTMLFVSGGMDMEHLLRRSTGNRLPWTLACSSIGQVLEGLAEAHRHKIVHRDLKPANVMVDPRGYMFIMDFGVAKQLTATFSMKTHAKGTLGFMPPDGYRPGVGYSVASDIFAVGAMLRRMIVGSNVLTEGVTMDEEVVGRLLRLEHEALPPMAASGVEVPPEVEAFVSKCMAWEPRDRFRDAAEAYDAFFPLTRFATDRDMVQHMTRLPTKLSPGAGMPIGSVEAVPEPILTHPPGGTPLQPGRPLPPGTPLLHAPFQPSGPPPGFAAPSSPPTGSVHGQVADASKVPPAGRSRYLVPSAVVAVAVGVLSVAVWPRSTQQANQPAATPSLSMPDAAVTSAVTPVVSAPDAAAAIATSPPVSAPDAAGSDAAAPDATPAAPVLVTMRLNVTPADAAVLLDGKPLSGPGPYDITSWPVGSRVPLHAEREGYRSVDTTIEVGTNVSVTLEPMPLEDPIPQPSPTRPERRGEGELVIKTGGWAVVYVDGIRRGVAPLRIKNVAAGSHVLVFENDETKQRKRVRVQLRAGQAKEIETGW